MVIALICSLFNHKWYTPEWLSACSIENPKSEPRRICRRCGEVEGRKEK